MAGTVGAIFNGALQLGSAVGLAAVSSITSSVQEKDDGPGEGTNLMDPDYAGRRAAFWFLFAVVCLETLSVSTLYKAKGWRGGKEAVNVHLLEAGNFARKRKRQDAGQRFSGLPEQNGVDEKKDADGFVEKEIQIGETSTIADVEGRVEVPELLANETCNDGLDAHIREITTVPVYTSNV